MKTIAIITIIAMLVVPTITVAQTLTDDEVSQVIVDAERDAKSDASFEWFVGGFLGGFTLGCCGGLTVVALSQAVPATPPVHKLLGKSPEYVDVYADAYIKTKKRSDAEASFSGCCLGTAALTATYLFLLPASFRYENWDWR